MSDTFTETTTKSWGSRLGDSIKGILGGILLIAIGIFLLFWNEGRTVKNTRALREGSDNVMSVPIDNIDPSNDGKLVYIAGMTVTEDSMGDDEFGITVNAIALIRSVEMYQWEENQSTKTKKKVGGSEETTTTYTYKKDWSGVINNSDNFKEPEGHINPAELPYESATVYASDVTVGAFHLNPSLIRSIGGQSEITLDKEMLPDIEGVKIAQNTFYIGNGSPSKPEIGDVKVRFSVINPHDVSIVAQQVGNMLSEYTTSNGKSILLLDNAIVPSDQMFKKAIESNKSLGWILRIAGILLIFIGFRLIFKPLSNLADVLPFLGNLVGIGTGLVSFLLAIIIGFVVIAIAWIVYRPVVGVSLLVIAGALIVYIISRKKKKAHTADTN